MKRINYIIGICILAASLITAATQGGDVFDGWKKLTKAGEEEVQPPHAPPHLYWDNNSGGTLKTEVKTPEDIKVNPENFGNSDDGYTKIYKLGEVNFFDIDLTDLIKKDLYKYYCLYRESSNRDSGLRGYTSNQTHGTDKENKKLRVFHNEKYYLWYYDDTTKNYCDFKKFKYTNIDYANIAPDTLIMEVSESDNYYCYPCTGTTVELGVNGGYFLKPTTVDRYRIIIEDNRQLKSPAHYWGSSKEVQVKLPENVENSRDTLISYPGSISERLRPKIESEIGQNAFDYICLVMDKGLTIDEKHDAEDKNQNRRLREYAQTPDGRTVLAWYRTTEDGRDDIQVFIRGLMLKNTEEINGAAICDLYFGRGILDRASVIDSVGKQLDLSQLENMIKITYTFSDRSLKISSEDSNDGEPVQIIRHEKIDTLYALPNERIKILQQAQTTGGIRGYLAWHSPNAPKDNPQKSAAWYNEHITFDGQNFQRYNNGVAYFAPDIKESDLPGNLCYIYYNTGEWEEGEDVTLIWDASNVAGAEFVDGRLMPPFQITIRHKYVIKDARTRIEQLKKAQEEHKAGPLETDPGQLNTAGFFERYEIHTPYYGADNGTSFRLAEVLSNYYVKDKPTNTTSLHTACANAVRWRVYDEDGNPANFDWYSVDSTKVRPRKKINEIILPTEDDTDWNWDKGAFGGVVEWPNIFYCQNLGYLSKIDKQKKLYITAEVGENRNTNNWFPVSLLTVYLEPYADFKTEEELKNSTDDIYKSRYQDEIEKDYVCLNSITFDAPPGGEPDYRKITNEPMLNYRSSTLQKELSEYAVSASFTYDSIYPYNYNATKEATSGHGRATGTRNVYRGEYALFKTLNDPGISSIDEVYYDWFCRPPGWAPEGGVVKPYPGSYFVKVYDRHYEYRQTRGLGDDEMGYFMYVDATEVPGVIVKLPVDSSLCAGTRLLVTAWVCNLQSNTPGSIAADLGFTFKGVISEDSEEGAISEKEETERREVILNKFYTGAARRIPQSGARDSKDPVLAQWQQVYFYFTIKPGEANYSSYLLEVANNCRHSNGADFAVDDIRIYKMNPELYVEREEACEPKNLVVRAGYEHILGVYGKIANSSVETVVGPDESWTKQLLHLGLRDHEFNVYYSFTDEYELGKSAADAHWLFLDYNGNGDPASNGRVIVSTKQEYYDEWNKVTNSEDLNTYLEEESKRRKLKAMLEYKKLYEDYENKPTEVLTPESLVKKADSLGIVGNLYDVLTKEDTTKIIGHKDFIQLSKYFFTTLEITPIQLSWQTIEDEKRDVISLAHVKTTVGETLEQTQAEEKSPEIDEEHKNDKLEDGKLYHVGLFKDEDFIKDEDELIMDKCFPVAEFKVSHNGLSIFVDTDTKVEEAFICSSSSTDLSATLTFTYKGKEKIWEGEEVPIDWYVGTENDEQYSELQVALNAFHEVCGADKQYRGKCGDLDQVGEFLGKELLQALCEQKLLYLDQNEFDYPVSEERKYLVAIPNTKAIEASEEFVDAIICTEPKPFPLKISKNTPEAWLGITDIAYPNDKFQPAVRLGLEDIKMCQTEDKDLVIPIRRVKFSETEETHRLGLARENGKSFANIIFTGETSDPDWMNKSGKVAILQDIDAVNTDSYNSLLKLRFIDFSEEGEQLKDLQFREGFEYELQVRFHEYNRNDEYLDGEYCDGTINFMIKIVPEYVTWTGTNNSRNWNNDANWVCSSFADLYKGGTNPNGEHEKAFAPMKFTKVTIKSEDNNPVLLNTEWADKTGGDVIKELENESELPYQATDNIEFDLMVTRPLENTKDYYYADRFYANTCNEIYFKPNATLMSQQYLTYDTARVEFEMEKDQWYLLSSPLKGVVAGDMYSPKTDSGRQVTDAFAPIVFDPNKNNRFAPAYYQRKWDNTAVLYFRNEGQNPDPDTHDSYISANWSTEYNDAEVFYTPGSGFSVHVENLPDNGTTSLVRLPKGDTSYDYYSNGESTPEKPNTQSITRGDNYGQLSLGKDEKTITVNLENQTDANKYFLAGNPFMTYLNMEVFLKENNLGSTYWLLNEKGETVVTRVSEEGILSNMQEATAGCVAPMQGFFVFREEPVTKVVAIEGLKYSTDMMLADNISSEEEAMTKSVPLSVVPSLYIEAERSGRKSSLSLIQREKAEVGYKKEEDVAILLNVNHPATPIVYSIAGTQATCINVIPEMANIPLGVYSEDESDVTLRFAGLEHFGDSLYLYDALKNEDILVDSRNAEVTVPGATHGRYFLNVSRSIQVESQIRVYTPMPGQVVVASTAGDLLKSVRVYDLSGKMVSIFDHLSTTVHQFSLPAGFYIVCAESESCTEKSKISVR